MIYSKEWILFLLVVDEVVADIDIAITVLAVTLLNYEFTQTKLLNRQTGAKTNRWVDRRKENGH